MENDDRKVRSGEIAHLWLRYKDPISQGNVNGDTMYARAVVWFISSDMEMKSSMYETTT